MLRLKNLCFSFGAREILRDINLHAKAGDFLALLGANGSGKSTLFKCILNILQPKSGEVLISNRRKLSIKERAQLISYVPQRSQLMMALSVKDFILLGLYASKSGLFLGYSREDYTLAASFCERFNLAPNQDVRQLSGGEFGRALMARALISQPKILLLDEPTSAMDLAYSVQMMQTAAELAASGLCVVAIIHDLNLAAKYCNRFAMLHDCQLAHQGGSELFNPAVLQQVFNLSCDVINHENRPMVVY